MSPHDLVNDPPVNPDAALAEVEAICRSSGFARSPRLQQFLRYVCELTLRGQAAQIKEYAIARDIFERGSDYSPHEDSVVRRQAHALRQKLQEYYANEGRQDAIRIDLPLGRYVPVFAAAEAEAKVEIALPLPAAVPAPAPGPSIPSRRWLVAAAICGLALFGLGWFAGRTMAPPAIGSASRIDPAVSELWGPWMGNPAGAVICLSNRMMAIVRQFDEAFTKDTPGRMRASPAEDANMRRAFHLSANGFLYLTPSTAQTKMGEAVCAVNLANLLSATGTPVTATQTRFINWDTLRVQNLIVFGTRESNQWIDPLLSKYPFRVLPSEGDKERRIVNTEPGAGERAEFEDRVSVREDEPSREYALISMLPGVDGRRQLLLISGLDAQSTQEASEYLTDPAIVRGLLTRMRQLQPGHSGPWRFQLVLEAEVRDKVPTKANVVALRVL
jgi:hypothetical protein